MSAFYLYLNNWPSFDQPLTQFSWHSTRIGFGSLYKINPQTWNEEVNCGWNDKLILNVVLWLVVDGSLVTVDRLQTNNEPTKLFNYYQHFYFSNSMKFSVFLLWKKKRRIQTTAATLLLRHQMTILSSFFFLRIWLCLFFLFVTCRLRVFFYNFLSLNLKTAIEFG